ncbi:UMTA protein [Colletotrichum tofieldiae]|uniref:UMTA protein n=1 Tax=Colletotrichum tofieldiae TaxID=708197 RepID=A0A166Y4T0_9PEZI|nr:UMTA protein [Colletotrichum tofieldiae]
MPSEQGASAPILFTDAAKDLAVVGALSEEDSTTDAVRHHYTWMLMDNRLFAAPVEKVRRLKVLDIGTGTGIWAIDVADEFPDAEVIGTDISAVQPNWAPPKCIFQIDDAQSDIDDWQRLYNQAFAHLKPGGWVENMEFDIQTRSENPAIENDPTHIHKRWSTFFWEAGDIHGRSFCIAQDDRMEKYMRQAGFVDVQRRIYKVPIGGWPKDPKLKQIGYHSGLFMDQSLDGWALLPIGEILGWTYEEVVVLVSEMRKALQDAKSLPYFNFHLVFGRKPGAPG